MVHTWGDGMVQDIGTTCGACRTAIPLGSGFCPRCGRTVVDAPVERAGAAGPVTGSDSSSSRIRERSRVGEHPTGKRVAGRFVPVLTVVACLVGVLGLELPVVEAVGGAFAFTTADIPYVGSCLLLLFVVLTLFPVIDTVRGRATFTPWLVVPALLGLVPLGLLELGLSYLPSGADLLGTVVPDAAVALGAGLDVLLGSDVAIILLTVAAIVTRVRASRWANRASATAGVVAPSGAAAF